MQSASLFCIILHLASSENHLLPLMNHDTSDKMQQDDNKKRVTASIPADALSEIDKEAKRRGISRQEMIGLLASERLSSASGDDSSRFLEMQQQISMMQNEISGLQQNLNEKKEDISYYRSEVARLSQELSSLSHALVEIKALPPGKDESIEALTNQMQMIHEEIASLKQNPPASLSILEKNQYILIAGILILLIIIAAVGIRYILR